MKGLDEQLKELYSDKLDDDEINNIVMLSKDFFLWLFLELTGGREEGGEFYT